jgi:hypothetical protein
MFWILIDFLLVEIMANCARRKKGGFIPKVWDYG